MGKLATRESQAADKRRRQVMRERGLSASQIKQLEDARRKRNQAREEQTMSQAARGSEIGGAFGRETLTTSQLASAQIPEGRIVAVEDRLTEDLIEEREEILEESGGASDETEELGDDPNEEIQKVRRSLRVLYSFNPAYTAGGFIESLNPDFRRIQVPKKDKSTKARQIRKTKRLTRRAASESVLVAKVQLRAGRAKIDDYKTMSKIGEPVLILDKRFFRYRSEEKIKLNSILKKSEFPIDTIEEKINSFLEIPEFEKIETPIIINKYEVENEFRLSPIEDSPPQNEIESDVRSPPRLGSFTIKVSREMKITTGIQITNGPRVGGGESGDGVRRDIDTELITDIDKNRQFGQQDFGADSELNYDQLDERTPPTNTGRGPSQGGRGY